MANNCNCGCMGTLKCIAGPMHHCPPPPFNPDHYKDFPFYGGPCPPCMEDESGCGCNKCCKCKKCRCGCHDRCRCSHRRCDAAMFAADAPLSVTAGENIPLEERLGSDCFETCAGCIRIKKAGLYRITWTANIPSYQNFCSRLHLSLNGSEIAGSAQTICCQADNTSASTTGQALVRSMPGGLLCLVSGSAFCIGGGCSVDNVFTLSITRIDREE